MIMKKTIEKIKISEINEVIKQMGVNQNTIINLTIETVEDDFLTLLNQIGQEAQAKGLTEEILEELLADES
jgi:ferritin-like protein